MKVQLFITCLIDTFFPEVGLDVVEVLHKAGVSVEFSQNQTCCGQPAFNAGYWDEAKEIAIKFLNLYNSSIEPIVIPSGSCAAMVRKGYHKLFAEDELYLKQTRMIHERTYELSEFLDGVLGPIIFPEINVRNVTYHPSCHLLRELGVEQQPINLLINNGIEVKKLDPVCCGFGGVFAVDQPEISAAMLDRKLEQIRNANMEGVVACDVSCLMQIEGGLRNKSRPTRCAHIAQILNGKTFGLR